MKSPCLLSLVIISFLCGGATAGIGIYQYFPSSDYSESLLQDLPDNLELWYYGVIIAIAAGCVTVAGAILAFIYNIPDGLDWFRFLAGIVIFVGGALAAASCVLLGITVSKIVNCGGNPACLPSQSFNGYDRLDYFTGALCALSGLTFVFAICTGGSTISTL